MRAKIECAHDAIVNIQDLKPHPNNRNFHSNDQIERLAKILEYQGFRSPIRVSNQSGYITAGHGRLSAAVRLGWTELPVDYQDYFTYEAEYADLIADNSIAEWSFLNLKDINLDIPDLSPDFDIKLLGIKDFTLDPSEKKQKKEKICPHCGGTF